MTYYMIRLLMLLNSFYIFLNFLAKFLVDILHYQWFQVKIFCSFTKTDTYYLIKLHIMDKNTTRRVQHKTSF